MFAAGEGSTERARRRNPTGWGARRRAMNFDPTEEQRRGRDLARDFAQGEIHPRAAGLDREQTFPYDIVADMARLGLMGLTLPEEYGGSGGDFVSYNLALEEISRADTSLWITNSGTDITGGVTVIARTGTREGGKPELTAFLVPQDSPGYTRGPAYEKLGWRASDQHPLSFENCRVPEDNLLGERGNGFRQFLVTLDAGRVAVAALSVGLAQACFDEALARAKEREQFGPSISTFQAVQFKLADMAMEIELARNVVLKAAWLKDNGRPFGREVSMAKVFASETAKRAGDQAVQIHGGEGFMETSAVARYWRQVKINEIGEGTSEI